MFGHEMREHIRQKSGLIIGVGFGPIKALAKLANDAAKKWTQTGGTQFDMFSEPAQHANTDTLMTALDTINRSGGKGVVCGSERAWQSLADEVRTLYDEVKRNAADKMKLRSDIKL